MRKIISFSYFPSDFLLKEIMVEPFLKYIKEVYEKWEPIIKLIDIISKILIPAGLLAFLYYWLQRPKKKIINLDIKD